MSGPRRPLLVMVSLLLLAGLVPAHPEDDPVSAARRDMRSWLDRQRHEMESFITEQDRQFAAFLEDAWRDYDLATGRQRDTTPKPVDRPETDEVDPVTPPADTVVAPVPAPVEPPPPPPAPETPPGRASLTTDYLGLEYEMPLAGAARNLPPWSASPKAAGDAWLRLSEGDHGPFLASLAELRQQRQLGDWGTFQLLARVAREVYPYDPTRQALLHWYLGVRAGLDLRLAYARPGYAVLYATEETVYQVEFLMYRKRAYYIHDPQGRFAGTERLRTYDAQPPRSTTPLRFDLAQLPLTEPDLHTRRLDWTLAGEERAAEVTVDRRLGEFLGSVPQTRLVSHFSAGLSPGALASVRTAVAADLEVRDEVGRVSVLLRFVQSALDYATDQEQFGREDYLYPDESLLYPQCDCEDRAALFAVLVRELVGLDVVGLDYPGHIAAAVAMPVPVPGDHFRWQGREFTVCDPTFIGAGPGRSMPIAGADSPGIIAVAGR